MKRCYKGMDDTNKRVNCFVRNVICVTDGMLVLRQLGFAYFERVYTRERGVEIETTI